MNAFQKIVAIVVFTFVFGTVGGCTTAEREHVDWIEKRNSVKKPRDLPVSVLAKPGPIEPAATDSPSAETAPIDIIPAKAALAEADPVQVAPVQVAPAEATPVQVAPVQDDLVQDDLVQADRVQADPVQATPIKAALARAALAKADPVRTDPIETAMAEPVPTKPALTKPAPIKRKDISLEKDIETSAKVKEEVHEDSFSVLANTFLAFRHKIAQVMRFPLENPSDIRRILSHLQVKDEKQLVQGWFAYNASVVAETPAYVQGIESLLREHTAENLLQRLRTERRFARQVPGAEDVLRRLRMEMRDDSLQLQILSQALLDVSEEWKHRKWGALEGDGDGDAVMHALVHLRMFIAAAEKHVGALRFIPDAHAEAYTPTDLILTLGARRILGSRTNEIKAIEHPKAFQCFRWARLNLDQCMVSSYDPSEEAWCAGVHGVEDIAGCWQFLLPDEGP